MTKIIRRERRTRRGRTRRQQILDKKELRHRPRRDVEKQEIKEVGNSVRRSFLETEQRQDQIQVGHADTIRRLGTRIVREAENSDRLEQVKDIGEYKSLQILQVSTSIGVGLPTDFWSRQ